jgi:hypothetical protein
MGQRLDSEVRRTALILGLLILLPVVMASSCDTLESKPGTITVDAPDGMCWSGAIGDSSKDGCGTESFEIKDEAIIVGVVQKTTEGHWTMTVTLEMDGKVEDTATTNAEFGVAQVGEK